MSLSRRFCSFNPMYDFCVIHGLVLVSLVSVRP